MMNQAQNSFTNTEIKFPKGDKLLVVCSDGSMQEFSMIENQIVRNICKIKNNDVFSIQKTSDNKS